MHKDGADLNALDYMGRGVVHVVANSGCEEFAKYLVKQDDVNLDLLDSKGRSALYIALDSDNLNVAKIFVQAGASIVLDSERLAKLLCIIGYDGDIPKLKYLIASDTNLEQSDYDRRTMCHLAASEGQAELLKFVIEYSDFDFDLKDRWGSKPLDEFKDEAARQELQAMLDKKRENGTKPKKLTQRDFI